MIKVIAIGRLKEKASVALVEEYAKRITLFTKFEMIEVADEKTPDKASEKEVAAILNKEAMRVLAKIKQDEYVILLDLHGKMMDSVMFAKQLDTLYTQGNSTITFVIGGSLGLGESLLERSNARIKMSDLTFPHQLVRVLLCEQIYRAFTIINNTPYHK